MGALCFRRWMRERNGSSFLLSSRRETVRIDPPTIADRPRPAPPWTTVGTGQLPIFGAWSSTSRYETVTAGTLITHDLEYALPERLAGWVVDLVLVRPLLAVSFAPLGRRMRHWIEAAGN